MAHRDKFSTSGSHYPSAFPLRPTTRNGHEITYYNKTYWLAVIPRDLEIRLPICSLDNSKASLNQIRITITADQTGLEEATRKLAPEYAHRGTALHKQYPTNNDQQTLWHKPTTNKFAGVNDLPHKCSHKQNPTISLLNAYALAKHTAQATPLPHTYRSSNTSSHTHTDQSIHSPTHTQTKAYNLLYTYRARHTFSHTHIQSKTYNFHTHQSNAYNLHTHTEQGPHSPTHIQSKAHILPHTYRARHTISHLHSGQSILSTTRILPPKCCHKHTSQDIPLPRDACYQSYSSRHTFSYGYLPAKLVLPYTITCLAIHDSRSYGPVFGEARSSKNTRGPTPQQSHLPWQT